MRNRRWVMAASISRLFAFSPQQIQERGPSPGPSKNSQHTSLVGTWSRQTRTCLRTNRHSNGAFVPSPHCRASRKPGQSESRSLGHLPRWPPNPRRLCPLKNTEEWSQIRHLYQQGLWNREIARKTCFSRDAVANYIEAEATASVFSMTPGPGLAPSLPRLREGRRVEFPRLSSRRLWREAREWGYRGSCSTLLRFVRPLRTARELGAVYRFETLQGLPAHFDWAIFGSIEVDGQRLRLHAFFFTLRYSRAKYVELTTDFSTPTFIAARLHAFPYLLGHPKEILYDNRRNRADCLFEHLLHSRTSF